MAIAVKRYTSQMTGAPSLSGQVGTLVSLLDACLVNGFNAKSPTGATQTAGVATLSFGSAHGYTVNDVIAISGANEAIWNNEFRVLTAATNSLTFAISSNATSPATGTLSSRVAPLGWTKPFSGTNKAAYLPQASYVQCYLRVQDDSSTPTSASGRWAKVRGYETMTDIDIGTGLFPTAVQAANALSIMKSQSSDSTVRDWWLVGDGGIFYMGVTWNATYPQPAGYAFGDCGSLRAGDAYNSLLIADAAGSDTLPGSPGAYNYFTATSSYNGSQVGKYLARSYTQIGSATLCGMMADGSVSVNIGYTGLAYPHPPDNGLLFSQISIIENSVVRSRLLPGIYQPLHAAPLAHLDTVSGIPDFSGRTFQAFDLTIGNGTGRCQCLMDITGPWR